MSFLEREGLETLRYLAIFCRLKLREKVSE